MHRLHFMKVLLKDPFLSSGASLKNPSIPVAVWDFYHGMLNCLWSQRLLRWAAIDWVAYKPQEFIFHSAGWRKSKMKLLSNVRVRACSLDLYQGHLVEKNGVSGVYCIWVLIPLRRILLSWPNHFGEPWPNTISLGLFFFLIIYLIFNCVCVSVWICVQECWGWWRPEASDPCFTHDSGELSQAMILLGNTSQ